MKTIIKFTVFITLILGSHLTMQAQNYLTTKVGFKASQPAAAADDELASAIGAFTLGVRYERGLNKRISILTGVDLNARGFSIQLNEAAANDELDIYYEQRIRYVDIPLAAKLQLGNDAIGLQFTAGGTFGFATSASNNTITTLQLDGETEREVTSDPLDLEEEGYSRFNSAVLLGAGIYGKIGRTQLFLDLTMDAGVSELIANEEGTNFVGAEISVGMRLPLGKQ
ncbi:MAG: outer membrane beta-barrel protein [Bacteroidota bacterium]